MSEHQCLLLVGCMCTFFLQLQPNSLMYSNVGQSFAGIFPNVLQMTNHLENERGDTMTWDPFSCQLHSRGHTVMSGWVGGEVEAELGNNW